MKPHIIKVAIDKEFILNELIPGNGKPDLKDINSLFSGKKFRFITTFTDQAEHYRILSCVSTSLSIEERFLQLKFRELCNGYEIIHKILNDEITLENIQLLPDIIITNNEQLGVASIKHGIAVLNDSNFSQIDRVKLAIKKIANYFAEQKQHPFWKIRIEDRYLLKNISNLEEAKLFFEILNIPNRPCLIEILYSDENYDYKCRTENGELFIVDKKEREIRKNIIKTVGSKYLIKFFTNAGHDRYLCTNSSLFILGNSITSDKETHITYFPLIHYYNEYFNVK